jgi:transposase
MAATAVRRPQQAPTLAAVQVAAEPTLAGLPAPGAIEMEFANGSRMRVTGAVDPATPAATVTMLARV